MNRKFQVCGGSVRYKSLVYEVAKIHELASEEDIKPYIDGFEVEKKEILEILKNFFLFLCSGFLDLHFMIYLYMDKWRYHWTNAIVNKSVKTSLQTTEL